MTKPRAALAAGPALLLSAALLPAPMTRLAAEPAASPTAALAADSSAGAELRKLEDDLWQSIAGDPPTAAMLGVPHEGIITDISPRKIDADNAALIATLARWQELRRRAFELSPEERGDLELIGLIIGGMKHSSVDLKKPLFSVEYYAQGPLRFLSQRAAYFKGDGTPADWAMIAWTLEKLPTWYADAQARLERGLAEGETANRMIVEREGVAGAEKAAAHFESALPARAAAALGPRHPVSLWVRLAGRSAAASVRTFGEFVKTKMLPRATEAVRADPEEARRQLGFMLGFPLDPERALSLLESREKQVQARALTLREKLVREAGVPFEALLPRLQAAPKSDAEKLKLYGDAARRAEAFIRSTNIIALPPGYKVGIQETPEALASFGAAFYQPPAIFGGDQPGVFFVAPSRYAGGAIETFDAIAQTTVHEALPGHDVQFRAFQAARDRIPRYRWTGPSGANIEGWAMYMTELMRRRGYFTTQEQFTYSLTEKVGTERAYYDVALNAGRISFDDAVKGLSQASGISAETLREDLYQRSVRWPLQATSYILGQMAIETLKDDYKKAKGAAYDEAAFHKAFLEQGPIPIGFIRRALLPGSAGTDALRLVEP